MWHIGPLACRCGTVSPRQVQAGDREPDSVQFGNATAAAAQPSSAGPVLVFLRWECASVSIRGSGGRGGDAVAAHADPPGGQPFKVHRSSAAARVLAGTGRAFRVL